VTKRPKDDWAPTKAELHNEKWRARRGGDVTSRIVADLQIGAYEESLRAHARGRLLDLGCGNAPFAGIYRPLVDEYVWADWPNSPHQLFELDCEVDLNAAPLPFHEASFDTILLSDVLEHIAEPNQLLAELRRILTPGGKLLIGVPFLYPIHEQPYDHFRYTNFQLEYFARKLDFQVQSLAVVGGPLDVLADFSCKILGGAWRPLARLSYGAWLLGRMSKAVRLGNNRAAWKMPLAYMVVLQRPTSDS
jgi:SAM-dependent methyltransferase